MSTKTALRYKVKKAGWYTDHKGIDEHKNAGRVLYLFPEQAANLLLSQQIEEDFENEPGQKVAAPEKPETSLQSLAEAAGRGASAATAGDGSRLPTAEDVTRTATGGKRR